MIPKTLIIGFAILVASFSLLPASASPYSNQVAADGYSYEAQTQYIPLDGIIGIEKSTVPFYSSESNNLPWGFVEGKIANHVDGYPVIIQFFKDGQAVHFAQTEVNDDGTYEYKFRVLNISDGHITHVFEGHYEVSIFKIVYLHENYV